MSSEQPIDPQAIEETKRQIRGLVSEIASLSRQDVEPVVYYAEFLQKVVTALAAEGGAIWTTRKDGGLELSYQINIRAALADEAQEDRMRHAKLLYHVLRNGEHMLVPPYSGAGGDDSAGNPTSYLLVVAPIFDDDVGVGVVEIFQRPTSGPASQRGYMKFLLEMCQHMGDFLQNRKVKELTSYKSLATQVERFSRTVHESLDPITTAYTIANEGRRLIGCDRVSVALRKGRKCTVKAVSGQDTMDTRANSVLLLSKLATAVMRSGEALWYTGDSSDLPPQIEEAVHDYVDETHTKTVAVLPLMKPSDYVPDGDEAKRLQEEKEEVIGCLIVEQIEDSRPQAEFAEGVELVTEHSSLALSNAVEHNSLFLMPVWRALGNAAWVLKARTLPKTLAVAALVILAIAALFLFPWHFRMKASGSLQPVVRKLVFSNASGKVVEVLKDHGDIVKKGDTLLVLENPKLRQSLAQVQGEIAQYQKQVKQAERNRNHPLMSDEQKLNVVVEGEKAKINLRTAINKLKLIELELADLVVVSPIDGQILDFKTKENLLGRPVQPGDNVMTVAQLDGEWMLELFIPESNVGHVSRNMPEDPNEMMDVEYFLMSDPENKYEGKLKRADVHDMAQLHEEHGHSVRMLVDIEENDLVAPRPGTEISARVYCGKEPIGYVWFHKLIEFIQSRWIY